MPPIYVMRHGQTEWNREGRMQGRLDSQLTALGRVQACRQGAILRDHGINAPARVSPAGRARTTAALAGVEAIPDARLLEISMGAWEGRTKEEIDGGPGVRWKFDAPGAEQPADLIARLNDLLADLTGPTVLITHGVVFIALEALLTGRGVEDWDHMDDPQGVILELIDGQARVLS